MKATSQTGLLSTEIKRIRRPSKHAEIHLEAVAVAPPYVTKPFAGLYKPFSAGCSILCNHPAVPEVKRMLQKAKENMGQDTKTFLLPDEVAAIKAELEQFQQQNRPREEDSPSNPRFLEASDISELVPEELFRKYTETDSRPLTPAPTLASAYTRASATRRCVTPDPIHTSTVKEKTMLVLDLRRSHSQETLSCYGGSACRNDTPLIRIVNVELTPASSRHSLHVDRADRRKQYGGRSPRRLPEATRNRLQVPEEPEPEVDENDHEENGCEDEEYVKRRGRRRRKRRAPSTASIFRTSTDPETLVAGLGGGESRNPSARPSLTVQHIEELEKFHRSRLESSRQFNVDSFLDYDSLRQLRRELTAEMVEMEFDARRKMALREALKTVPQVRVDCDELKALQKVIRLPEVDSALRFSLPRKFSRASVRFELPMDSRAFNDMTPMEYLHDNVYLTSARRLLYSYVFNVHRVRPEVEPETEMTDKDQTQTEDETREISGNEIIPALGTLMGKSLNEKQANEFYSLFEWSLEKTFDFRTFSAICAVCERLLAEQFYPNLPTRKEDPCQAIEKVDFECLEMKMKGKRMDPRLVHVLKLIKSV